MSIPKKHHFLPEFYQRRWCSSEDKKLQRYSRPIEKKIVSERRFPSETGFEPFLYSLANLPAEEAQEIEQTFFKGIDDRAATALDQLHRSQTMTKDMGVYWWKFVITLMTRMPSDVRKYREFRRCLSESVVPILEEVKNLPEFANRASEIEGAGGAVVQDQTNSSTRGLVDLMSNEKLNSFLRQFHWRVISTDDAPHELLTSDRPVDFQLTPSGSRARIRLPIGPRLLFLGSENLREIEADVRSNKNQLTREVNAVVVGNAEQYVIGRTDTQSSFVASKMGRMRTESFVDMLLKGLNKATPAIEDGMRRALTEQAKLRE